MDLPVIIIPLPNQGGFSARLAAPIEISAEGPTADEAQARLSAVLQEKLQQGMEFRILRLSPATGPAPGGWLPDDELTQEWRQHMKDYRDECDAADRARLAAAVEPQENSA